MKKILLIVFVCLLSVPLFIFAAESTATINNPIGAETFVQLVEMVVQWILNIAMVLAPLVIVYGGLIYMTAAGDTGKITQARNIILYAALGLLLALLAWSLVGVFKDLVTPKTASILYSLAILKI
jgi:hypothetical protein